MNYLLIPEPLQKEVFRYCLIAEKDKKPIEKGWQERANYSYDHPRLKRHCEKGKNYGVIGGYGNLLIIDYDSLEAFTDTFHKLPTTLTIKTGSGGTHVYLQTNKPMPSFKATDHKGNTLIDFQGIGKQAVGAGSTHPNGKKYTVIKNEPIAKVTKEFITAVFDNYIPETITKEKNHTATQDIEIKTIKESITITEILKKYGVDTSNNPTMCCLGHNSKRKKCLSFDKQKGLWHCFHCGKGGDLFTLVQLMEGTDFKGAIDLITGRQTIKELNTKPVGDNTEFAISLQQIRDQGFPPMKWLVQDLIPARGITIFGGTSGCFKTWTAQHLALQVAVGNNFLGHFKTQRANVLYIDEENGEITLPNRFELLIKGYKIKERLDNLKIAMFKNIKLDTTHTSVLLKNFIQQHDIKLVIIDSMVRCMQGEEDKAKDVRMVFETVKKVFMEFTDLSFVILHHTRKGSSGMDALRGSGDFAALSDVVLMFNATQRLQRVNIHIVKNRHLDLSTKDKFTFQVKKVNDGLLLEHNEFTDGNTDLMNSCKRFIIDYCEDNSYQRFNSTHIRKVCTNQGFTKYVFYESLRGLVRNGDLIKEKRGMYRFESNPLISEESIE